MQPNRPDERARIEAAGGRVVFNNGYRVRGILAMSRALGINNAYTVYIILFTPCASLVMVIPSAFIHHHRAVISVYGKCISGLGSVRVSLF